MKEWVNVLTKIKVNRKKKKKNVWMQAGRGVMSGSLNGDSVKWKRGLHDTCLCHGFRSQIEGGHPVTIIM